MRMAAALLAVLLPIAGSSLAVPAAPATKQPSAYSPQKPQARPTVKSLLAALAKAETRREANRIERELQSLWSQSGSPSADLLLERGEAALQDDDLETAQEIFARLTAIAPKFAEAWHQRAAVATQMENYEDAMASLRHVLALEPNHFGALAELGQILEEFNDKAHALDAYRRAIALNPHLEGIDERIRELSREVEGQGI